MMLVMLKTDCFLSFILDSMSLLDSRSFFQRMSLFLYTLPVNLRIADLLRVKRIRAMSNRIAT